MVAVIHHFVPSGKGDRILLLVSAVLILLSSYQLFYFSVETDQLKNATELGELFTTGAVKRRHARTLHWRTVAKRSKVYLGDIIYTPKNTTAEITWGKDGKIELEPDSMVQLDEVVKNRVSILLLAGKVKPTSLARSDVAIQKPEEIFRIVPYPTLTRTKKLSLELDALVSERLKIDERWLSLSKESSKIIEYVKSAELPKHTQKISDFVLSLVPSTPQKIDLSKVQWITLAWTKLPIETVSYQLELSRDKTFGRVVSHKTRSNELSIQLDDHGLYYWRVKAFQGKDEISSEVGEFTLVDAKKRTLSSPSKPSELK